MARLVIHVDIELPTDTDPIEVAEELFWESGWAFGEGADVVHASWDA